MQNLSALAPLIGRWATTITMLHPPEAKGEVHRAVDTYRWLPGQAVVVHEVEAHMGGSLINSLEIYTTAEGEIRSRNFDSSGAVSDYRASMTDRVWRVEGDSERFVSAPITGDIVEGRWALKVDGAWVDWMTVRLERVGAG